MWLRVLIVAAVCEEQLLRLQPPLGQIYTYFFGSDLPLYRVFHSLTISVLFSAAQTKLLSINFACTSS
jgi:hypothetical protein